MAKNTYGVLKGVVTGHLRDADDDHYQILASAKSRMLGGRRLRAWVRGYYDKVRAAGGSVDVDELPKMGIKGNSHMVMMDKNSDQVAGVIQDWLVKKGLYN